MNCALVDFLNASQERLQKDDSAIAVQLSRSLENLSILPARVSPESVPACSVLTLDSVQSHDPLMQRLLNCHESLHWRIPGFGRLPLCLQEQLAVTEIIGPSGMIFNDQFRFGVLLQAAGVTYPEHQHAAEELYCIVSGTAYWRADGNALTAKPPGSFVYHSSHQTHGMVTVDEPLIALWGWAGDIDHASYGVKTDSRNG